MGLYAAKSSYLVAQRLRLGHAATRLLVHMALECLDSSDVSSRGVPPRRYFGGRQRQAIALGYHPEDADTEAARAAVKRAVHELTGQIVLTVVRRGQFGRVAEYELQVESEFASDRLLWEPRLQVGAHRPPAYTAREGDTGF